MSAARFGEDDGFLLRPNLVRLGEGDTQRFEQCLPLGIVFDGGRQLGKSVEVGDFLFERPAVGFAERFGRLVLAPLFGGFVEGFVVLVQLVFQQFGRFLLAQLGLEPVGNRSERARDGKCGRGQQLAQHQRHQGALPGWQGLEILPLQVFGYEMVEAVFAFFRGELFHQRQALGVRNVGCDLAAQGAVADGLEAGLEHLENPFLFQIGELLAETLQVAEGMFVDETHQAEQLQQGDLQRRRRQQQLVLAGQCLPERVGDDVGRFVDITKPVCLVDHHQVPRYGMDITRLALGKLIGADDDLGCLEGTEMALLDCRVIRLGFENPTGQEELFGQFLKPLLAQVGWCDDQNAPLALGPLLREHEARLDGLAQTHLIRQKRALGKGRVEGEQCGIDLVGIEVDLCIDQRAGKLFDTVRGAAAG
ncbi:hypothetical protein GALL_466190 [mine drainage metagenome]|uniref:Uncharacterized protein n=1 Tax=mine drainage metagenome TaxID=410659 RepID=A0A1J5PKU5_9ZZZZ